MNAKVRSVPEKIILLKILKRRLPISHPKRPFIEQELYRREAGFWGEKEVDKKLERIDQNKYTIFSDLRLSNGSNFFQMDTLILSTTFALIIEAKTISGTLYFDLKNHQFYRINDDGKKEGFSDPVSQARSHQQQLKEWLLNHKLPTIPIDFLVIICKPNSIFHISPHEHSYAQKISGIAGLTWEIDKLSEFYQDEIINEKDLKKISKTILKSHTPLSYEILPQYNISKSELLTGVHCPDCEFLPLIYQTGKWYCPKCRKHFKDAHREALNDYFLLFNSTITNSEYRKFLHINNPDMVTKMLREMNFVVSGSNKGRVYSKLR